MQITKDDLFDRFDYISEEECGKCGVIDRSGHWLIPPEHDTVHVIESDIVHIGDNGCYRLTDRYGQLIRYVAFNRIRRLYWLGRYYALRKDGKWAVSDGEFNLLTDYIYDDCKSQPGDSLYVRIGDNWQFVLIHDRHGLPLYCLNEWKS